MERLFVDPADRHTESCDTCAMDYRAFRGGITYREAYHWIAWDREHTSRSAVLRTMGRHKRDVWARHQAECREANLDTSFPFGFNVGRETHESPARVSDPGGAPNVRLDNGLRTAHGPDRRRPRAPGARPLERPRGPRWGAPRGAHGRGLGRGRTPSSRARAPPLARPGTTRRVCKTPRLEGRFTPIFPGVFARSGGMEVALYRGKKETKMNNTKATETIAFSHGFDAGNYAAAYETTDYETAAPAAGSKGLAPLDDFEYRNGFLLGFFSSCELNEIPADWRDEAEALRARYGR